MDIAIPYAKQSINSDDISAVEEVLKRDYITRGPAVREFEESVAAFCHVDYAVAFNSGTSALTAAYHACELSSFDRIVTTPNTFVGTVAGGCQKGASLRFVDIDERSGNIDLEELQEKIVNSATRGRNVVVPVHFAGLPVDVQRVERMLSLSDDLIIEDAAHAFGSKYRDGSPVGCCRWSDMTVFSFHPAKNITTAEGGVVTTHSAHYYERLCSFRDNGIKRGSSTPPWYYEVVDVTGNSHMGDLHAALGISQLKRIELFAEKRRELVGRYSELLADREEISLLEGGSDELVVPHLLVALIDFDKVGVERGDLMRRLKERGIGTQVHYIPLYRHPYFLQKCGDLRGHFPQMESYYSKALSLPLYYDLTHEEVERVVAALLELLNLT